MVSAQVKQDAAGLNQWALGTAAAISIFGGLLAPGLDKQQAQLFRIGCSIVALAIGGYAELTRDRYDWAKALVWAEREKVLADRKRRAPTPNIEQVEESSPVAPLPFFDFAQLQDPDRFPCLCVFGPQGSGKSTLMKYLAQSITLDRGKVYDLHNDSWLRLPVYYRRADIVEQMQADIDLVERLQELPMAEKLARPQEVRILDEAPVANNGLKLDGESKLLKTWVLTMSTFVRKMRMRLIVGAVVIAADDLGISAGSRDVMTAIFVGNSGVALAMNETRIYGLGNKENKHLRDRLALSLERADRPGLIYHCGQWHPLDIPTLQLAPQPVAAAQVEQSINADPRSLLERCLSIEPQQSLSPQEKALRRYQEAHPDYDVRKLQQGFRYNGRRFSADEIRRMLDRL